MTERDHRIAAYDYDLPPERIAQQPLAERDASRLMLLDRRTGASTHHSFGDLPHLLRPGDLLVVNRSRVFPARLLGTRAGGGQAEVLLVRPRTPAVWDALVRPARRLRAGAGIRVAAGFHVTVEAPLAPDTPLRSVRLSLDGPLAGMAVEEAIERYGHVPLPPYVRRPDGPSDRERYQTVFARETGSVAAPTAGLHFTPALLNRLAGHGVETTEIVLHVGPGTFRPVETDDVREHRVDPERFHVPALAAQAIAEAKAAGRRVIAIGTTTTRALESAADGEGRVRAGEGETPLLIAPGYSFRAIDGLITNFHLPRSSLLLLVSALAGRERVLAAYREAIEQHYRFYSYGDAMLIV